MLHGQAVGADGERVHGLAGLRQADRGAWRDVAVQQRRRGVGGGNGQQTGSGGGEADRSFERSTGTRVAFSGQTAAAPGFPTTPRTACRSACVSTSSPCASF